MSFLAIDTTTPNISVSLGDNNKIKSINKLTNAHSSSIILPMIKQILGRNQSLSSISGVIYSKGPGCFTGLRVGISVVQAICLSHNLPAMGLSSLSVLEFGAIKKYNTANIISAIDAKMGEMYIRINNEEMLTNPQNIKNFSQYIGVGSAFHSYGNFANCYLVCENFYPLSENMISLAMANAQFNYTIPEAYYLRDSVAQKQ